MPIFYIQHMQRQLIETIRKKNINALFIDECFIFLDEWKEMIKELKRPVDVIWIATNALGHHRFLSSNDDLTVYNDFIKVKLDVNLRNCESIVKEAFRCDERFDSGYKEGLVLPPKNFPNGVDPTHFNSCEDAITKNAESD